MPSSPRRLRAQGDPARDAGSTPLRRLRDYGQSFWLDDLTRDLLRSGELARRVAEEGLRGVTSNPKIFADAMDESEWYDADIARLARAGLSASQIVDQLTIEDVRDACDVLRPVYDESDGADGYVSLEVSPHLAHQSGATLVEARRLFGAIGRPNAYIKIPGTLEGVAAIEDALAEGINVNITLLFSIPRYEAVSDAYQRALEHRVVRRLPIDRVTSVASFFLSRIDVLVDELLGRSTPAARSLRGRAAIASAKLAYRRFRSTAVSARWQRLAERGGKLQRLLWASTSVKNDTDRDVKYVEPLIGPDTVSTMPYPTAQAFADHGRVETTVGEDVEEAEAALAALRAEGIDFREVTDRLVVEGIEKFVRPYDALLARVAGRINALADG